MRRADLTARELADMLYTPRDTVKYLERGFRDLVEQRHVYRDDDEREDTGDRLLSSRYA